MLAIGLVVALALTSSDVYAQSSAGRRRALELFRQSERAYGEGRFQDAARLLRQAHTHYQDPTLTYNLARALEGAGDLEGAVTAYREYLTEAPSAPDAGGVRARIENLQRHLRDVEAERTRLREQAEQAEREREAAAQRNQVGAPGTPLPPRQPEVAPWVIAGVGAAGLITGAILGALGYSRRQEAENQPNGRDAYAFYQEASTMVIAANVAFGVGGAALLAGGIWGIVDLVQVAEANAETTDAPEPTIPASSEEEAPPPSSETAELHLRLGPTSIEFSGSF